MEDYTLALRFKVNKRHRRHTNLILFLLSLWSFPSRGNNTIALSMVPRGRITEVHGREFLVKTASETKVNIEFHRNGTFQEASGKNLNQGDDLEPGDGLISLSSAAREVRIASPRGYWTLEKDSVLGWIYDFDLAIIDAKTGKLLERKKISQNL